MPRVIFEAGGPREPVYAYLRHHGYIMSDWSDKHWIRADGVHLHVYGTGSKARVTKGGEVLVDDDLDIAVELAKEIRC